VNDSSSPLGCQSWVNLDSREILRARQERLDRLRKDAGLLPAIKDFYRDDHFVEFVNDWGMTRDPRLAADGKNPVLPFILFPRQEELLRWFDFMMKGKFRGNVDKTRDCGASWCALAFSCYRFLFFANNDIGFGSRKEELVDAKSDPKALFPKARMFIANLPKEFRPVDWNERRDAPYLKLINPENGATIVGEAGDNIGRGGRTLMYFVDEHAHIERPTLVEGALSENTNTQINISTHDGTGSLFFRQCQTLPKARLFEFDWRDDPRKTQEWYDTKRNDPATDPVIFAQEVDRDPSASVADGFIPLKELSDAMDRGPADVIAHGPFIISVDVAAMGNDKSIINVRRGAINFPQKSFPKSASGQLAAETERLCDQLLAKNVASLGAIIYELEGVGYGFHENMKTGRYKELLRPIHPGRKLASVEFYNERARFWSLAKEWLEEGGKSIVMDRKFRIQATALRYEFKETGRSRKLLLESKKQYKSRMAADSKNKAAGPSPDEADAWAMSFTPVKLSNMTRRPELELPDFLRSTANSWQPLDAVMGY